MSHDWEGAARRVADELAADAAERERAAGPAAVPTAEVELLRRSGLLTLLVPAGSGGGGQPWAVGRRVVRAVAAADASVGHLLGYHYLHVWRLSLATDPATRARLEAATARESLFWGGASNPRDDPVVATPDGDGYRLDGRRSFATGARVADVIVVSAVEAEGAVGGPGAAGPGGKLTFALPADTPGVTHVDDWDNLGQRLTASGSVEFAGARAGAGDVIEARGADERLAPRPSLQPLAFQLMLAQLYVAVAEGALAAAADYTRTQARPWPASGVEHAADDPYVLAAYGTLAARTAAAGALVDRAAEALDRADAAGDALDATGRGEAAVAIAAAKVVAGDVAIEVGSRVFELTGARATASRHGLDRFWRNARTLTLHDPAAYKAREVGDHLVNGAFPPPTGYA